MSEIERRGHKLEELRQEYKNVCENEAAKIETNVMNQLISDFTFDEMLHNDSNAFFNYRYLYDPSRLAEISDNPLRPQLLRVLVFNLYRSLYEKLT